MSKRPTKKAAKKWKVSDRVRMTGEIIDIDRDMRVAQVHLDGDDFARWIDMKALRPAVEVFKWSPEKAAKKKAGKK